MFGQKIPSYSQNTDTSCVYFYIKVSGLSPIYPNVTFKIIKSGTYIICQNRCLCAFNKLENKIAKEHREIMNSVTTIKEINYLDKCEKRRCA